MADLLQRVFMVFVRPYYLDETRRVFYTGDIYGKDGTEYKGLSTDNLTGTVISPVKLNHKDIYQEDPWFLHSTYTSYEDMRQSVKDIITIYGTDHVKCASYIPVDYVIVPSE